jgi:hypothetical protein
MSEQTTADENEPAPASNPDPPAPQPGPRGSTYLAKIRSWLTAKWWRWTVAAILGPALAVFGVSLAQLTEHGAHRLVFGPGKHAAPATAAVPLGVTSEPVYSYGNAVALATGVSSGLGYADLLAGPSDSDPQNSWAGLLTRYDGAPIGALHVDFVLTGQDKTLVRVTNVQIQRVGPVMPPLSGTYIPIPHGGAQEAYQFTVNMDTPDPAITRTPNGQTFPDFNVQLAKGEQLTLSVNFLATHYSSRWVLLMTYLTGTRAHVLRVEAPNGQPFAVTGQAKRYKVMYTSNFPAAGYHLPS